MKKVVTVFNHLRLGRFQAEMRGFVFLIQAKKQISSPTISFAYHNFRWILEILYRCAFSKEFWKITPTTSVRCST